MHKPRLFRLFISSTFSDFVAEREALQKRVFPELEAFCRERGASFQAVDLRWGITEEAQQSHDTLRLCLEEVRRCQALSSPPNFAVLLGDRYGWEPVPARIPEHDWKRLLKAATPADRRIIRSGYTELDRNTIPAVRLLKAREGVLEECLAREYALLQALRRAADAAGFTGDERLAFFASATHQEIALGALAEQDESGQALHPNEHVHVYIRRIPDLPRDQSARAFLDWDVEHDAPDSDAHARLRALESQLQQRLPDRCRRFSAGWQGDGVDPDYLDTFCEQFLEDQKAIIERELSQVQEETASELRNRAHLDFVAERSRNFRGRTNTLRRIARYLKGQRHAPLILHGAGGTGKSALLARAFDRELVTGDQSVRLIRFIGGIPTTESLYTLLTTLTEDLALAYDQPEPSPAETIKQAIEGFGQALTWSSAERPLVLFLDALDQLESRDGAWMLQWLPKQLGKHTRIVASTRGGPTLQAAQQRYSNTCIELPAMPPAEGRAMLKAWLADARDAYYSAGIAPVRAHRLTAEQFDWVIERFEAHGNPLWLKLAYENVRHWTSYEPPRELPATVTGMIEALIDQRLIVVENHPPVFTTRALAYLSAARFGLSEEELNHALATDPEVMAEFEAQNERTGQEWLIDPTRPRLPPVLWSRLYFDLAPYLVSAFAEQTLLYRWFHREFGEVIAQRYLTTAEQRETTHGHLAQMFEARAPGNDDLFRRTDISAQPQAPALRRVMEQPWQLAQAGRQAELTNLLSDFGFCLGKCAANHGGELVEDWLNVKAEPSSKPAQWRRFMLRQGHYLRRGEQRWPAHKILLQVASEDEPGSPVRHAAEQWLEQGHCDWVWLKRKEVPGQRRENQALMVLEGHAAGVNGAQVLPDGRILSWSDDGMLRLWHDRSGASLAALEGHTEKVLGSKVLLDGRILSWSRDGTLRLWDGFSVAPLVVMEGHTDFVYGVELLPDGRILSWSWDGTLRLWHGGSGARLAVMEGHTEGVLGAKVLSDGRILSWSRDGTLRLWNGETGAPLSVLKGHANIVNGFELLPDLRLLSWSSDSTLRIWDGESGASLSVMEGHTKVVSGAEVLPDGRILSWSYDGTLRIWDGDSGASLGVMEGHTKVVSGAEVLPDGRILSWSWDGTLRLWDCNSGAQLSLMEGHTRTVLGAQMLPDGRILSWSDDATLRLWDGDSGASLAVMEGHSHQIEGALVMPDGCILSWSRDGTLRVWDGKTQNPSAPRALMQGHTQSVWGAEVLPDGRILSWSDDGTLRIWDGDSGAPLALMEGHTEEVWGAEVLPDGRILSWSWDGTLRLWDAASGASVALMQGHTEEVWGAEVLPDRRILSWSWDGTLRLWHGGSGAPLALMEGHTAGVLGAEVLPDGRILSWSLDGTLRLWDGEGGAPLAVMEGHTEDVSGAEVLSDGRILSWSADATLRLWDGDSGASLAVMEGHAHRIEGVQVLSRSCILSWSKDGELRLWDGESPESVVVLPGGRTQAFQGVQILSDSRLLLWSIGNREGTLRMFNRAGEKLGALKKPWIESAVESGWCKSILEKIPLTRAYGETLVENPDKTKVCLMSKDGEWRARWQGDASKIVACLYGRLIVNCFHELAFLTPMRGSEPFAVWCETKS